jgi:hypothetical protein
MVVGVLDRRASNTAPSVRQPSRVVTARPDPGQASASRAGRGDGCARQLSQ